MAPERKNKEGDEKDENGKITIIIPTYNRSLYLKRAIESVLNQSYENIEIIVVDDASTDDTKKIVNSFSTSKIKYVRNDRRMGPNRSRNIGLKHASGNYIAFLDDDDYYSDRNKLKEQLKLFEKNERLGFVGCGYYEESIKKERMPNLRGKIDENLLISFSDIETSTIMIKKSIIDRVGYLDEKFPSEQNHDFFYRISKISEFDYVPKVMVVKGKPKSRISTNAIKKIKGYILFHKKHMQDIKRLSPKKQLLILFKFFITVFLFFVSAIFGNPYILPKLYEFIKLKTKIMNEV